MNEHNDQIKELAQDPVKSEAVLRLLIVQLENCEVIRQRDDGTYYWESNGENALEP